MSEINDFGRIIDLSQDLEAHYVQPGIEDKQKYKNVFIRSLESASKDDHFSLQKEKGWFARGWIRFKSFFSRSKPEVKPYDLKSNFNYLIKVLQTAHHEKIDSTQIEQIVKKLSKEYEGDVGKALETFATRLEKIVVARKLPKSKVSVQRELSEKVDTIKNLCQQLGKDFKERAKATLHEDFAAKITSISDGIAGSQISELETLRGDITQLQQEITEAGQKKALSKDESLAVFKDDIDKLNEKITSQEADLQKVGGAKLLEKYTKKISTFSEEVEQCKTLEGMQALKLERDGLKKEIEAEWTKLKLSPDELGKTALADDFEKVSKRVDEREVALKIKKIESEGRAGLQTIKANFHKHESEWSKVKQKMNREDYNALLKKVEDDRDKLLEYSVKLIEEFVKAGLSTQDFEKSPIAKEIEEVSKKLAEKLHSINTSFKVTEITKTGIYCDKVKSQTDHFIKQVQDLKTAGDIAKLHKIGSEMIGAMESSRRIVTDRIFITRPTALKQLNDTINESIKRFNVEFFSAFDRMVGNISKDLEQVAQSFKETQAGDRRGQLKSLATAYAKIAQYSLSIEGVDALLKSEQTKHSLSPQFIAKLQTKIDAAKKQIEITTQILNASFQANKDVQACLRPSGDTVSVHGGSGEMQAIIGGRIEAGAHVTINITKTGGLQGLSDKINPLGELAKLMGAGAVTSGLLSASGFGQLATQLLTEASHQPPLPQSISTARKAACCFAQYTPQLLYNSYQLYSYGFGLSSCLAGGAALTVATPLLTAGIITTAAYLGLPEKQREFVKPYLEMAISFTVANYGVAALGWMGKKVQDLAAPQEPVKPPEQLETRKAEPVKADASSSTQEVVTQEVAPTPAKKTLSMMTPEELDATFYWGNPLPFDWEKTRVPFMDFATVVDGAQKINTVLQPIFNAMQILGVASSMTGVGGVVGGPAAAIGTVGQAASQAIQYTGYRLGRV